MLTIQHLLHQLQQLARLSASLTLLGFLHISPPTSTHNQRPCVTTQRRVVIPEWTKWARKGNHSFNWVYVNLQKDSSIITNRLLCIIVGNKTCLVLFYCIWIHSSVVYCCKSTVLTACNQSLKYNGSSQSSLGHSRGSLIGVFLTYVLDTGNQIVSQHSSSRQFLTSREGVSSQSAFHFWKSKSL